MGGKKVCAWLLANCEVQLCSTLAAMSILGVVVMCPMMLDPSIDTLVSSFDQGMCQTVYHQFLRGLSNCTWTSCREGCTAEVYSCYHLIVVYVRGTEQNLDAFHNRVSASANLDKPNTVTLSLPEAKSTRATSKFKKSRQKFTTSTTTTIAPSPQFRQLNNKNSLSKDNFNDNKDDDDISADIIESILGGRVNGTGTTRRVTTSTTKATILQSASTPPISITTSSSSSKKKSEDLQFTFNEEDDGDPPPPPGEEGGGGEAEEEVRYILPPSHEYVYELNNTFIRDLDANLVSMMLQLHQNIEAESYSGDKHASDFLQSNLSMLGIGALLPNVKGCVYPSEIACTDFIKKFGRVGGPVFPCYISKLNSSTVVTTIDKAAAVRHIFYSFIPLVISAGVFTYLFYRVGLIGSSRRKKQGDEEAGSDDETPAQRRAKERNGGLKNGAPPVVRKRMKKKFLPNRNSGKKRRKGKIYNKNRLNVKQMSVKSPSSSRRTPSMSIGAISSDDGYSGGAGGGGGAGGVNRTSVQLL